MKYFCLALIYFYQRVISPVKGFSCAHHQLHRGDTCSNAVKKIISDNSLIAALPLISARFSACKSAADSIIAERTRHTTNYDNRSDLPLPCDCSIDLPTPSGGSTCSGATPCDACAHWPNMKRRTRRVLTLMVVLIALIAAYFYGSQITKIEVVHVSDSQRSDSLMQKLLSRDQPTLRALVISKDRKIYSQTKSTGQLASDEPLTLEFDTVVNPNNVTTLEIHDARFSAAGELIVLGQVLEHFDQPQAAGSGKRFAYKFKSRWGF